MVFSTEDGRGGGFRVALEEQAQVLGPAFPGIRDLQKASELCDGLREKSKEIGLTQSERIVFEAAGSLLNDFGVVDLRTFRQGDERSFEAETETVVVWRGRDEVEIVDGEIVELVVGASSFSVFDQGIPPTYGLTESGQLLEIHGGGRDGDVARGYDLGIVKDGRIQVGIHLGEGELGLVSNPEIKLDVDRFILAKEEAVEMTQEWKRATELVRNAEDGSMLFLPR